MNVIQMVLKGDSHQPLVVIILNPKDFRLGRFGGTLGNLRENAGNHHQPLKNPIKSRPWNFGVKKFSI